MKFRSLARQVLLACCLTSLWGCIEYRFDRFDGQDRYLGWVTTRPDLDPKLGSKGKMFFLPPRHFNPYIGGRFSKRRLTINVGVIQYLSRRASLELGYRRLIFETDNPHFGDGTGSVNWNDMDEDHLFYFGGRINF
jgi:hypothetical protein